MLDELMLYLYRSPLAMQWVTFMLGFLIGIATTKIISHLMEPRYPFAKATDQEMIAILNKIARGSNESR